MKWSVIINGDISLLNSISDFGTNPRFLVNHEYDQYILRSIDFEKIDSYNEVLTLAEKFINDLNGAIFLENNVPSAIKLLSITKTNSNGNKDHFQPIKTGRVSLTGLKPTITTSKNHGTTIVYRPGQQIHHNLIVAIHNPKASKLFHLIKDGSYEFADIYKIIEILLSEKGSLLFNWVPENKIKLLKWTANHDKSIGLKSRHLEQKKEPPKNPMSLKEAQSITKYLIQKYLDE